MRILATNDDGYRAEGLLKLATALARHHDVAIVAPAEEKSGAGHSLTFGRLGFVKADPEELFGRGGAAMPCYGVYGSPADAVKFAVQHIFKDEAFDLVVSGINSEFNVGTDIVYSGTFGAAREGTLLGIRSIAVSTRAEERIDYGCAAEFIVKNLDRLYGLIPPMTTLNVNLPFSDPKKIRGVAVVPVGHRKYNDWYEEEGEHFRLRGYPLDCSGNDFEDDCAMCDRGFITLSPVSVVATDEDALRRLRGAGLEL